MSEPKNFAELGREIAAVTLVTGRTVNRPPDGMIRERVIGSVLWLDVLDETGKARKSINTNHVTVVNFE